MDILGFLCILLRHHCIIFDGVFGAGGEWVGNCGDHGHA